MKFLNIISTAILLISPTFVTAAPAVHELHRRDCPSVDTIRQWIRDNAEVGDNTVFYTAGATQEQAKAFSSTVNGNYWNKVFGNDQWLEWIGECRSSQEQDQLLPRMGEALAKESTGIAYILMLKGRPIQNFWKNYEYPSLHENGVQIIAVNAEDFGDRKEYDGMPFESAVGNAVNVVDEGFVDAGQGSAGQGDTANQQPTE